MSRFPQPSGLTDPAISQPSDAGDEADPAAETDDRPALVSLAIAFARLGLVSFGGPIAHLGYFREEFVVRRRWLSEQRYASLVAMCQMLPGPTSSQVVFAIGLMRGGLAGAVIASTLFTAPSAVAMIAFAYVVGGTGGLASAGWLHGLKLAAVAVVASAVIGMWVTLCRAPVSRLVALAGAAVLLVWPAAVMQPVVIVAGALAGLLLPSKQTDAPGVDESPVRRPRAWRAVAALVVFAMLLVGLPLVSARAELSPLAWFDAFFRAGALVFGGGHVVLPLLSGEVVGRGWVSQDEFVAGYAAAQAVPGPLFTFAGYLGAVIGGRVSWAWAWAAGVWCMVALFLPGWLLVGGVLPWWRRVEQTPVAQRLSAGAGAAVVGLLIAALYHPIVTTSVESPVDVAAVLIALAALAVLKVPAWMIVVLMAAAGQWGLPLVMPR